VVIKSEGFTSCHELVRFILKRCSHPCLDTKQQLGVAVRLRVQISVELQETISFSLSKWVSGEPQSSPFRLLPNSNLFTIYQLPISFDATDLLQSRLEMSAQPFFVLPLVAFQEVSAQKLCTHVLSVRVQNIKSFLILSVLTTVG
jgi:hypothetical protein